MKPLVVFVLLFSVCAIVTYAETTNVNFYHYNIVSYGSSWRTSQDVDSDQYEIQDNGTGIAPDILDKIFEPFFTTKKVGKGMGLGLSVSYGLIRDHDGEIEVKSTIGEGTTFRVTFPREKVSS